LSLRDELASIAGTDLFGVADAVAYGEKAPKGHGPADVMKGARSIVLIGTRMLDAPLDGLPVTAKEYTANFHVVNTELNRALFEMAGYLERRGNKAFPIPYKEMPGWNLENRPAMLLKSLRHFMEAPVLRKVVGATLTEDLSYRHMAIEAGMGELGVNNLLLVPGHGARVRLVALLTDARLKPGAPVEAGLCRPESCGYACVRACPVGALSEDGRPTDKVKCLKHYLKLGMPGQSGVRCGLCIARCPANKNAK
jgi:epoxyqueuosine reductase QueG